MANPRAASPPSHLIMAHAPRQVRNNVPPLMPSRSAFAVLAPTPGPASTHKRRMRTLSTSAAAAPHTQPHSALPYGTPTQSCPFPEEKNPSSRIPRGGLSQKFRKRSGRANGMPSMSRKRRRRCLRREDMSSGVFNRRESEGTPSSYKQCV